MRTKQAIASVVGLLAVVAIMLQLFKRTIGDIQQQEIETVCGGCGYLINNPLLDLAVIAVVVLAASSLVAGWPIRSAQMRR